MSYSIDLKERVLDYVQNGGSQLEASRLFSVSRKSIYNWLHRASLETTPCKERRRKLDKAALAAHVKAYPDAVLRERASHFGVHINAIWCALRRLNITKKNDTL